MDADLSCNACGQPVLDIDVKCGACGAPLASTGALRLVGTVALGQYEIVEVLGQGGMSVVYRGRHRMTDQDVALKILPPELAAHAQLKSRFVEEAKALAQLDHPNIVHLYNFGEEGGCFVLAMQFVRGHTLERLIWSAQRMDWRLACRIGLDTLSALEYAHSRGIVHRDMKPSNVLVRESDGAATVMDFGIAKMTTSSRLTATGQTMGTVRYMSPEQVRGQSVDRRTDIYSFAMSLYEAVVGDTPFDGDTHFEIMTKHLSEAPVPPSKRGVTLPAELEDIMLRSMAKHPDDRPSTAAEFAAVLERLLEGQEIPALPVPSAGGSPAPVAGVPLTGLAGKLEPTGLAPELKPKIRPWMYVTGAAILLAGGAAAAGLLSSSHATRARGTPDAAPVVAPRWPESLGLPSLTLSTVRSFDDLQLRVAATSADLDVARVRDEVVAARSEFEAFLRGRGLDGEEIQWPPLNVVLVAKHVFCSPTLYKEGPVPSDCADVNSHYLPKQATLFLVEDPQLRVRELPFNVAMALCLEARDAIPGCDIAVTDFVRTHEQFD